MLKNVIKNKSKKLISGFISMVLMFSVIGLVPARNISTVEASQNDPVVVVLDAGHDYAFPRPTISCTGLNETDINLSVAQKCEAILKKYPNVKVYMTNKNGECMGTGSTSTEKYNTCLPNRLAYADKVNCDLYVSMHCNAYGEGIYPDSAKGSEVFISVNNPFYSDTLLFAANIANGLADMGFKLRGSTNGYKGVKTWNSTTTANSDYLAVNRRSTNYGFPSVLIEYGFVTNVADANRLRGEENQQKLAQITADAIIKYFNLDNSQGTTLETTCNFQTLGWTATIPDGLMNGTKEYAKYIQALKINVNNNGVSGDVMYSAYVRDSGWQAYVSNGATAGTIGNSKPIEAISIKLTGELEKKFDVYYRTYSLTDKKWLGWAKNGDFSGRVNMLDSVAGIQVMLVDKGKSAPGSTSGAYLESTNIPDDAKVYYYTHVQSYGWKNVAYDGASGGTVGEGKRLEAIRIGNHTGIDGSVEYQVHVQSYGWMDWVSNGAVAGTIGKSKRIEAIKIKLTGELAEKYDVYYRVQCQTYGWLDWAKNGEAAGTSGKSKRLEAIQIVFVEKGGKAPGEVARPYVSNEVSYSTHVQTYGWQDAVVDGAISGTTGKAKRLEGIKINNVSGVPGSIRYKVHCQTYGWMDWVSDGALAGTTGEAKRLEAIQIELTGEAAEKYDVYYRVHSQTYGWLGWAKNGECAGTAGLAKRLEAIQIVYVLKGASAPGSTDNAFVDGTKK